MMVSLPVLARRLGNDPGIALWLAVLSPLALFSFVSSGHNDALMLGLMLAGITVGTGGRLRWGIALCALAATIKLPAAAGIVFLVADECTRVDRSARWRVIAESVAISVLVVVGVTVGAGLGWTWLGPTALHVPTELRVLITPLVSVGTFVYGVLHAVGLPVTQSATVSVVQAVGAVAAVSGILWMLFHTRERRRRPPVRPGPDPVRGPQPDAVALVPDVGRGRAGRHLGPAVPGAGRRGRTGHAGGGGRRHPDVQRGRLLGDRTVAVGRPDLVPGLGAGRHGAAGAVLCRLSRRPSTT